MQTIADWQAKYSDTQLDAMRQLCDPLADAVAALLDRKRPSHMLDEVYRRARDEGGVFADFLDHAHSMPRWVEWDRVEHARRLGLAFFNARATALLVSSLVEGYSLGKAVHVLVATGRLHQDVLRRIYETGQMTHNLSVKNGLRPGNVGHRTMLEVRLLHAMVRKYLRAQGWDTTVYDEPINQEDMAFTIIEFDYLATRGMERLGAELREDDREAFHHLWRYGAYLNGVHDQLLTESLAEEKVQYARIRARQYNPTDESRMLAHAVITALADQPPLRLPAALLFELSRLCIGDELADAYALPRHPGWREGIRLIRAGNRATTLAHYRIPGFGRFWETVNFQIGRRSLIQNLEPNPEKRAFRNIG